MTGYIGAIDQGTTSTRFIVFDRAGDIISVAQKEHRQIFPKPGWVEHDPVEIWDSTQEVIREAMRLSGIGTRDIAAVGITNQRETTLLWEHKTGAPLHNAVVWQDTRTDRICRQLAEDGGTDRFRKKTGLPLATYFSGPKIKWILENVEGAREKAERNEVLFGNIDSWLIWKLTGEHVTDVTNASRTQLMDLDRLDWDSVILEIMEIPRSILPEIRSSSEIYGSARGVLEGIPICGDLGDQQAALFGQCGYAPGEAKNTYGTGCFMLMNTGESMVHSQSGLLTTPAYQLGDEKPVYALEGSIAVAGALVQWLRDNLQIISTSAEVESQARNVADNGGVYFVPAFSGLFAPHWRSDARGVIVGLTGHSNKGHIARAALEATAYQTREVLEAMHRDSGVDLTALKVDGGMIQNELLMQFQADVLGVPVIRPVVAETTALGAAYAAGLAVGFWEDLDDLKSNWKAEKKWHPDPDSPAKDRMFADWLRAVERTLNWVAP
jgi:glycerol kinase